MKIFSRLFNNHQFWFMGKCKHFFVTLEVGKKTKSQKYCAKRIMAEGPKFQEKGSHKQCNRPTTFAFKFF